MRPRHILRGGQVAATALIVAVALLSVSSLDERGAEASGTLGATPWQVHMNNNVYLNPYLGAVHGHPDMFNVAPPIPAADDPSWANCGPGAPTRYSIHTGTFSMCPSDTSIGLQGGSILPGCWVNLNFTYFQAFVNIPSHTSISAFTVNLSGADDGAQIKIFNSRYPDGVVPTGGNIYQGTPQSTANLASYARAGEWNRVVIQQVDDCAVGNNLQSATISINGAIVPPPPPDTTPPVVTPIITGTLGDNGWYRSNVSLQWSVSDPETLPAQIIKVGCTSTFVTQDSFGMSVTCQATSNGGTTRETVVIKRDATPPSATVMRTPAANSAGWSNSDVTLSFNGFDAGSGIASCSKIVIGEGTGQSATGNCMDKAGNVTSVTVPDINVDKTRPVITAAPTTPPNANGWHNAPVTVRFTCSDPGGSGFASGACPADQVISNDGITFVPGKTVTDRAGNTSVASALVLVKIDTAPPTASASRTPEANASGWNNSDVTVSFDGSDGNSGIDSCSPAVVLGEGTGQSASGTCTDEAGNVSAPAVVSNINVDKTRPTIAAVATSAPTASGWYTSDVTVRYTCTDAGGSGLPSGACPPDQVIAAEGITTTPAHTVTDVAGNVSDPANVIVVKLDKTSPTATATAAPAGNGNGWTNTDVTVTFSGTDAASGIASCSAPVVLGEGAEQSASGTCTDQAGNVSAPASVSNINVDKTRPTITAAATTAPNGSGWYNADVTVQYTCTDAGGSGLPSGACPPDQVISTEGITTTPGHTVTDVAGNVSDPSNVIVVKIDKTKPVITAAPTTPPNANGWHKTTVTVRFTCTDPGGSGFAPEACPPDQVISNDGITSVPGKSVVDQAGNTSSSSAILVVSIDTSPPGASASRTPEANAAGWNNTDVTVSFNGEDGTSGIDSCSPAAVLVEGAGQSATGTCVDKAGNVSAPATVSNINVDKTRPTIAATATTAPNGSGWYNADVTIRYTCTDAGGSGLPASACPPDQMISAEGVTTTPGHTVTDVAGNVSDPSNVIVVKIDKTKPTATATAAPASNGNGWNNTDVSVTFGGTDATSGIASCSSPVVLNEGVGQSASGTCTDNAGHVSAPATASGINVDKTTPTITVTGVTDGATYIVNGVPTAGCLTTDALSGVATSATVSFTGGPVGSVTVTCAGASDKAGNAAAAVTATYAVTYAFCGFSQPLLVPVQEFKAGSTIPVKFCLKDANGVTVTTATGTVEAYVDGVLKGTVVFRFSDGQYIANVPTKDGKTDWPTGDLELRAKLNDGTAHSTNALSITGVKGGLKLK